MHENCHWNLILQKQILDTQTYNDFKRIFLTLQVDYLLPRQKRVPLNWNLWKLQKHHDANLSIISLERKEAPFLLIRYDEIIKKLLLEKKFRRDIIFELV